MSLIQQKHPFGDKEYVFSIYISEGELAWFRIGEFISLFGSDVFDRRHDIVAENDIKLWKDLNTDKQNGAGLAEFTLFVNEYGLYALLSASNNSDIAVVKEFFVKQVMSNVRAYCYMKRDSAKVKDLEKREDMLIEKMNTQRHFTKILQELSKALELSKTFDDSV